MCQKTRSQVENMFVVSCLSHIYAMEVQQFMNFRKSLLMWNILYEDFINIIHIFFSSTICTRTLDNNPPSF
jgi:hypothetical protein